MSLGSELKNKFQTLLLIAQAMLKSNANLQCLDYTQSFYYSCSYRYRFFLQISTIFFAAVTTQTVSTYLLTYFLL